MSRHSKGFAPLVILLIIALLATTGFLSYQNYQLKRKPDTTSQLPTPPPDPLADWQTYTHPSNSFEIKFPPHWEGPGRVSGTVAAGQVNFMGKEGSVTLVWGDGFGGGLCTATRRAVNTQSGPLEFCITEDTTRSQVWRVANEGPSLSDGNLTVHPMVEIKDPVLTNEPTITQILSTFKFVH